MIRKILSICTVLLLAACGTIATPVYDAPTQTPVVVVTVTTAAHEHEHPTATPVAAEAHEHESPTATPVEASATPIEAAIESTVVPTDAPTQAPAQAAIDDPLKLYVDLSSAEEGSDIFHNLDIETDTGPWKCMTCHNTESEEVKIGPSLVGVLDRAATRIEGQGPYTYIYNSIRDSHAFIVPGFEDAVHMPHFTEAQLNDEQIYNLMAYLVTLK